MYKKMLTTSTRFCATMEVNPIETIKVCKAEFIKGYLEWRLIFSRIKKQSSIVTYWKIHSMLYMNMALRYMEEDILLDIRNVRFRSQISTQYTNCVAVDTRLLDAYLQA
jgi:hypothetical protein